MTSFERRKTTRRADDARYAEDLSKRYEFLLRHTNDIILAVRYSDRKILEASTAALEAYEYSMEELKSMTIDDLNAGLQEQIVPRTDRSFANTVVFETIHRKRYGHFVRSALGVRCWGKTEFF